MSYRMTDITGTLWKALIIMGMAISGCSESKERIEGSATHVKSVPITAQTSSNSGWLGLVEPLSNRVPRSRAYAFLGKGRIVFMPENDKRKLGICAPDGTVLATWTWGPEWYFKSLVRSRRGDHVLVCLSEELTVTNAYGRESCRIGIVGPGSELRWVKPLPLGKHGVGPRSIALSNDGHVIGIAGIGAADEVQLWSNAEDKLLWRVAPEGESGINDIVFSPNSEVLYAGGTSGWVYAYEAASGKLISKFLASRHGATAYGYRVSKVDASPDGALLAAGTGPDGDVYVWDAKTGRRICVIATQAGTITDLAFSPDSSMLATCGVNSCTVGVKRHPVVDVWRIRQP